MSEALSHAVVWVPVAAAAAVAMDLWAALLHGRVWHAWLWPVHRTHHEPRAAGARFEANDALSILHAPIAVWLVLAGCRAEPGVLRDIAFGLGVGMSAFGAGYVVVHDGLAHGRLPVRILLRLPYLRAVVRAHRVHHSGSAGGSPYGFFLGRYELRHRLRRSPASTERGRGPTARSP